MPCNSRGSMLHDGHFQENALRRNYYTTRCYIFVAFRRAYNLEAFQFDISSTLFVSRYYLPSLFL